jgi:alkylation response protein AidB-like acyl-CoA dehydrogenase
MDFRFDEMERGLIADARAAITRSLDLSRFRSETPTVELWRMLGAADWLHGGLPVEHGGAGISLALQAGIAHEAGAVLAVDEWVNNAFILPFLLSRAADADLVPALLEHHGANPGFLLADGRNGGWLGPRASGTTSWCFGVWPGFDAYWLESEDEDQRTLVRVTGGLVTLVTAPGLALSAGRVELSGGSELRIPFAISDADLADLRREAVTLHCAALVGAADEALRLTVEYAKVRRQYGKAIGQFQALKHILADVRVASEIGGNAAYYAAVMGEVDASAVPAARLHAVSAALSAARTMIQIFGGMGFTWESDVHLFLKTALNGAVRFGSTDNDELALGQLVLGAA